MNIPINIDKSSSKPMYLQVFEEIKKLIENGELKPGQKLPPIRKLAQHLEVNTVTVVSAYRQLENNGNAYSKGGSGTYVSVKEEGFSKEELNAEKFKLDFATAWISPENFPVADFKIAIDKVLDKEKGKAFLYDDSEGFIPLRIEINKYLLENGIKSDYKNIQIVSGAQQGIDIIAKSLIDYEDCVVVENPTYMGAVSSFNSRGAKLLPVEINKDGIDLDKLQKVIKVNPVKLIYVMPSFHNPTGICYDEKVKQKLLDIAYQAGCYVVEDDYLSDIDFGNGRVKTLKELDKNDIVIYIKSFSKIFMPGLRLGFMIIPKTLQDNISKAKYITDISTSGFIQRSFYEYFNMGAWKKQLIEIQKIYLAKYNLMIKLIDKYMSKELEFLVPNGGLNLWCRLPKKLTSDLLYSEAKKVGINFVPGNLFFMDHKPSEYFRLSFAAIEIGEMEEKFKELCEFFDTFINANHSSDYNYDWFMKFI
jgi:2-aminoadipate transaminase